MEEFKLSESVDNNKVFIVYRSELISRLDATVYKDAFHFKSKVYPVFKLSDLVFINPTTPFNNLPPDQEITFVPMEAINEDLGTIISNYSKTVYESKGYTRFKEKDLIWAKITPCMQNGKSAIVERSINGYACGSTEFFIIRPKNNEVLIEYIHYILRDERILKTAMNFFGGSAGQQRVSKDFLLNLQTPLPPLDIQRKIVNIINDAYSQKQQKETEAKDLLDSIDDYLLGELGITLPNEDDEENELSIAAEPKSSYGNSDGFELDKENLLVKKGRLFLTGFSEVVGQRIDPDYTSKMRTLLSQKSIYSNTLLKELLLKQPQYGANEEAKEYKTEEEIRYIRITDIDNLGNLKDNNKKTASVIDTKYLLNYNDLLFARSGSVGRCYIHKNTSEKAIFAGYLIRFVLDEEKCHPDYIFYYCNSNLYKYWVSAIERPAVQSNINSEEYKSMPIPLPPLSKQNEIAQKIQEIRQKANELKQEATIIIESVKQQIEQMILGN